MPRTMNQLLDNITWFTLTGPHAQYASGAKDARRYATGFSPIIGFADSARPDFDTLAAYCQPDEQLYCPQWKGEAPAGWNIYVEKVMFRMVWDETTPAADEFPLRSGWAIRLRPQQADAALELAQLTNPGPFGPRTIEPGVTFGWFEDGDWWRWPALNSACNAGTTLSAHRNHANTDVSLATKCPAD